MNPSFLCLRDFRRHISDTKQKQTNHHFLLGEHVFKERTTTARKITMVTDPSCHNHDSNMLTSVNVKASMENENTIESSDLSLDASTFIPGSTNGSLPNYFRYFKLFSQLNDDIKLTILSYVAEAPFERFPECYPKSMLTSNLPQVCHKFHDFANHDMLWKQALERSCHNEPKLWNAALTRLCIDAKKDRSRDSKTEIPTKRWIDDRDDNENNDPSLSSESTIHAAVDDDIDDSFPIMEKSLPSSEEKVSETLGRTYKLVQYSTFKELFIKVVTTQLRFTGPIYEKNGHIILGEPYTLHIGEQRYCIMINEIMKNHPEGQRREGQLVTKDALFIHANRLPSLQKSQTAVLVQITRCEALANDTFGIEVVPFQHVWIERAWEVPSTFCLVHGQVLKMGHKPSNMMNYLIRQESMVQAMDNMTRDMTEITLEQENATANSYDTSDDDDDVIVSNQYSDHAVSDGDDSEEEDADYDNSDTSSVDSSNNSDTSLDQNSDIENDSLVDDTPSVMSNDSDDKDSIVSKCEQSTHDDEDDTNFDPFADCDADTRDAILDDSTNENVEERVCYKYFG
jgi:hypothetical protein